MRNETRKRESEIREEEESGNKKSQIDGEREQRRKIVSSWERLWERNSARTRGRENIVWGKKLPRENEMRKETNERVRSWWETEEDWNRRATGLERKCMKFGESKNAGVRRREREIFKSDRKNERESKNERGKDYQKWNYEWRLGEDKERESEIVRGRGRKEEELRQKRECKSDVR